MNVPMLSQHDKRWSAQRLGTKDGTTIGGYGCGITDVTMVDLVFNPGSNLMPNNIDDIFTNGGAYVALNAAGRIVARSPQMGCNMLDWGRIQGLLPNCAHVGAGYYPDGTPANLGAIKRHLDGGGLVILQVFWGGNKNLMHFVLAVDYDGDDIIVNDPEKGDRVKFSSRRFGSGKSATDIYAAHFFSDAIPNTPPPPAPPAPAPAAPSNPEPGKGSGPAPAPQPPKEEEVTQAQHDADMAALKEADLAQINSLKTAYEAIITDLRDKLAKLVPPYVASETVSPEGQSWLTKLPMNVVDFADREPIVPVEPNRIVDEYSRFFVGGREYVRSVESYKKGFYYGYPPDGLAPHSVAPVGTPVLDLAARNAALNTSQKMHAMVADRVGFWGNLKNLFGGKK